MRDITPNQLRAQVRRAQERWGHIIDPIERDFGFPRGIMYAIGSRETNLDPYFVDHPGDNGFGHGLWQIDKRYHPIPANWRADVHWQCRKGAEVLRDCHRRCRTWEGAANCYNSGKCNTSATTHGDYGPDVMERMGWVRQFLDAAQDQPIPQEDMEMLMFWHGQAIFLDFHGQISPFGLHPRTVDALLAAGVRVAGRPGDDSELMRMFGAVPVSNDAGDSVASVPEYPTEFLQRNGWLEAFVDAVQGRAPVA